MASPKTKRDGKKVTQMNVSDLRSVVNSGGKSAQKARNELTKRGVSVEE